MSALLWCVPWVVACVGWFVAGRRIGYAEGRRDAVRELLSPRYEEPIYGPRDADGPRTEDDWWRGLPRPEGEDY